LLFFLPLGKIIHSMLTRYLTDPVTSDLAEKMVFVAGPRQVGKTTMAKQIIEKSGPGEYFSWDRREDRKTIRAAYWPSGEALVVLDELHKWRNWKRWIKGEYDRHGDRLRFLVTGSARLDIYRRGGDSLQGRYHHYRLHPLTLAELEGPREMFPEPGAPLEIPLHASAETLKQIIQFGGFPEPFLAASTRSLRRWQKEHLDRFFREDVRDLETIRDLSSMQLLSDMLAERVASPLSLNSLREDLEVSHKAIAHWVDILERLYHVFRIRPFLNRAFHGLKKMPKVYLWDPSQVSDAGARFENVVALHLLKLCHFLEDGEGHRMSLHYVRDTAGREVDFLVTCDNKPWFLAEAKLSETRIDRSLPYFRDKLNVPAAFQVVLNNSRDFEKEGIRCLPAHRFLAALI